MPTIADQLDTATQSYLDNVPPFRSASQCAAYISACSQLIVLTPAMSGNRESSVQFDVKLLQTERQEAQKWYDANGGSSTSETAVNGSPTSAITRANFQNLRC